MQLSIAQEYNLFHLTEETEDSPLPSAACTAALIDNDGKVWTATYSTGIVRYDGNALSKYGTKSGITPYIFIIKQDNSSRIWAGNINSPIVVSKKPINEYKLGEKITFTDSIDNIVLPKIRAFNKTQLITDSKGNIWTSFQNKVLRYFYDKEKTLQVDTIHLPDFPGEKNVQFSFFERQSGKIAVISDLNFLHEISLHDYSITKTNLKYDKPTNSKSTVSSIIETENEELYIVTLYKKIYTINTESNFGTYQKELSDKKIYELYISTNNKIYGLTIGAGLFIWDPDDLNTITNLKIENGLISDIIWEIIEDKSQNIWMATNTGLSRLHKDYDSFGHYTNNHLGAQSMLPANEVNNTLSDIKWKKSTGPKDETLLLVATSSGISLINQKKERQIITTDDGILSNVILHAHQDEKNRLWISSKSGITCMSRNKNSLFFDSFDGIKKMDVFGKPMYYRNCTLTTQSKIIRSIWLPKSENDPTLSETIWAITDGPIVMVDNKWHKFNKYDGIDFLYNEDIAKNQKNQIIVANYAEGLFVSKENMTIEKIKKVTIPIKQNSSIIDTLKEPLFINKPISIDQDTIKEMTGLLSHENNLWLSSSKGLLKLDGNTFELIWVLNDEGGLIENNSKGILFNKEKTQLWLASRHGLYQVEPDKGEIIQQINKKDGLVANTAWGYPSFDIDSNDRIYFATNKGLSLYSPNSEMKENLPPNAWINDLTIDIRNNGNSEVSITYSGMSYSADPKVIYKTQLVGYDDDWSDENRDNNVRYTNLPAYFIDKEYTFKVLAKDANGNWTDNPSVESFKISPPWFFHWISFIGYIILGIFLSSLLTKWRTRQLKARQRKLEQIVTERTAEVVAEKEKSEELLLNILPAETAKELKENGFAQARNYDLVSIIFTDFENFSGAAEKLSPQQLIKEIDYCFSAFDEILDKYNIEKIKTIGDAYMAAAGLPKNNVTNPADAVTVALELRDFMVDYRNEREPKGEHFFRMRIGIHTGPVVSGIVGIKKFAYDIWGDTVNIASRMESNGEVDKVNISENTRDLIKESPQYTFESRGEIEVKNKGAMRMYYVDNI